jgi:hypothetical protein
MIPIMLTNNLRVVAVDILGHGLGDYFPRDIMYHCMYHMDCLLAIERILQQFEMGHIFIHWTKLGRLHGYFIRRRLS